jgi:hypothetical protein
MDRINAALAAMKSDEFPVIARYAKEFDCDRSTLSRRYRGVTTSREEYRESMSVLSNQQSASLILYINTLTTRGIPPTPAMIRNFVYDITKEWVSKNWVTNWTKRHSQELESSYLQPLDMARKIADNLHQYAIYFNQLEEYCHGSTQHRRCPVTTQSASQSEGAQGPGQLSRTPLTNQIALMDYRRYSYSVHCLCVHNTASTALPNTSVSIRGHSKTTEASDCIPESQMAF